MLPDSQFISNKKSTWKLNQADFSLPNIINPCFGKRNFMYQYEPFFVPYFIQPGLIHS